MDEKYKTRNKHWILFAFLLFGISLVCLSMIMDLCGDFCINLGKQNKGMYDEYRLQDLADGLMNVVFVYSAIVAAVVIFFYGMIDKNRLGVPYRLLMSYTLGSRTIPVLFFLTLVLSALLPVISFFRLVFTVYTICGYVVLVDGFLILEIFLVTSFKHCKKEICRLEKQTYIQLLETKSTYKEAGLSCFFGFFSQAINSEEYILHKKEFLVDFLKIPFGRTKSCRKSRRTELGDVDKIVGQQQCIYQFYYINIVAAFEGFDNFSHTERSLLYEGIYGFIKELSDRLMKCKGDNESSKKDSQLYRIAISGIVNGIFASNVDEKDEFCNYILSNVIEAKTEAKLQTQWLLLFQELMYMGNAKPMLHLRKHTIDRLGYLLPIKETENIEELAKLWKIWADMYAFSEIDKMMHFRAAIYTMTGRSSLSRAILEVLLSANIV